MRALAPFIAGSSGMRYRAFVPYSILGTGIWASAHILIGYFFSRSIDTGGRVRRPRRLPARDPDRRRRRHDLSSTAASGSRRTARAAVRWMEGRGADPLARRPRPPLRPQLRFLWDRVTPGGTFGLEFTTLMAMLAVGLFVLVAYTVIVSGDPGPTPGDETAFDVVERLRSGWLIDIAKVVTALGSAAFVCRSRRSARCCWRSAAAGPSSACSSSG